jgi:hypothetical protein
MHAKAIDSGTGLAAIYSTGKWLRDALLPEVPTPFRRIRPNSPIQGRSVPLHLEEKRTLDSASIPLRVMKVTENPGDLFPQ